MGMGMGCNGDGVYWGWGVLGMGCDGDVMGMGCNGDGDGM